MTSPSSVRIISNRPSVRLARLAGAATCFAFVAGLAGCLPGSSDAPNRSAGLFGFSASSESQASNRAAKTDLGFAPASGVPATSSIPSEVTGPSPSRVRPATLGEAAADTQGDEQLFEPAIAPVPIQTALKHFFESLAEVDAGSRERPVTIVHLGDDHIAADRFSAGLRAHFQKRFGDAGRGLMAPGVFRVRGLEVSRSGPWTLASSVRGDAGPFGLTGVRADAGSSDASLKLISPQASFDWAEVTFATGPDGGSVKIALDGQEQQLSTREAEPSWKRVRLARSSRELSLRPAGDGMVRVLSWAVGMDRAGLRYVNLGLPGATALTLQDWSDSLIEGDLKSLDPDLIIFGYGTIEAFRDGLELRAYNDGLDEVLARLRAAAPRASLLVIGPPDVATKPRFALGVASGSDACRPLSQEERADYMAQIAVQSPRLARWHPPLNLRPVRQLLARAGARHGAHFWDWSQVMGGPCGIHAWVHATPPLAAANHIHLTAEGSRRSADDLFMHIMYGYDVFLREIRSAAR